MTRLSRILRWLIWLPVAVVLVAFSIANRAAVTLSFDPFERATPAASVSAPLYVVIFTALAVGIVIGGLTAWMRQGKWRRAARDGERGRREAAARLARNAPPRLIGIESAATRTERR